MSDGTAETIPAKDIPYSVSRPAPMRPPRACPPAATGGPGGLGPTSKPVSPAISLEASTLSAAPRMLSADAPVPSQDDAATATLTEPSREEPASQVDMVGAAADWEGHDEPDAHAAAAFEELGSQVPSAGTEEEEREGLTIGHNCDADSGSFGSAGASDSASDVLSPDMFGTPANLANLANQVHVLQLPQRRV